MKKLFAAVGLVGLGWAAAPAAHAQSATAGLPAAGGGAAPARAPDPRQANLSPEEIKREQQMQLLEARTGLSTGNTSLGRAAGPVRQFDTKAGGFTVRKFKPGKGGHKDHRARLRQAGARPDAPGRRCQSRGQAAGSQAPAQKAVLIFLTNCPSAFRQANQQKAPPATQTGLFA